MWEIFDDGPEHVTSPYRFQARSALLISIFREGEVSEPEFTHENSAALGLL
jgi:hypothetical protein